MPLFRQLVDAESLSETVRNNFTSKQQCLIEQYKNYEETETLKKLNGKRTLLENIADNTGIKLAYRAYRKWMEKFGQNQKSLVGLDYTWDQLFWVSAAQTWCGVYREGSLVLIYLQFHSSWLRIYRRDDEKNRQRSSRNRKIPCHWTAFEFTRFHKRLQLLTIVTDEP